ncbi:MBG domain-containing protein [Furfurilactobacillus siliginis]|uniref:LPXTG-motif protein cell wall anchor domain protein n=1 Tax=Furfurilactobacillus siliginis TaxID=348151 RepID=A0A0R2L5V1_9LACO|nr:MBG domain-containing protein [Furfurilactobacillus siliginis]KRN97067.1 LPXTG-motif protein cell wall anchor domain protein [Furfurilactobacillus siliginis]GEK27828.1 hypothetical protein LSI01_01390 [Furfurilactobacillus siliginis]
MKRYKYDEVSDMAPDKTHFKMYKAGKQWLVAGLSSMTVLLGGLGLFSHDTAFADTTEPTTNNQDSGAGQTITEQTHVLTAVSEASQAASQATSAKTVTSVAAVSAATPSSLAETTALSAASQANSAQSQAPVISNAAVTATSAVAPDAQAEAATLATVEPELQQLEGRATSAVQAIQEVAAKDQQQAAASDTDTVVPDGAMDALQTHAVQETSDLANAASLVRQATASQNLASAQLHLSTVANITNNLVAELTVAQQLYVEDQKGVSNRLVGQSQTALNQLVLGSNSHAFVDAYGDLVISTADESNYQTLLKQINGRGLMASFRAVVDPSTYNDGTGSISPAAVLSSARIAANGVLQQAGITDIKADLSKSTAPIFGSSNVTFYNLVLPYALNLQKVYNNSQSTAQEIINATNLFAAAVNMQAVLTNDSFSNGSDQSSTNSDPNKAKVQSKAMIVNVDMHGNPLMVIADDNNGVSAGAIINPAGNMVNPVTGQVQNASFETNAGDASWSQDGTAEYGKVGDVIPNTTVGLKIPGYTFDHTEYSTGSNKFVSLVGGQTMQVVYNYWRFNGDSVKPTTTALKATIGNVTRDYDGTDGFTLPSVTLSGLTGVKVPTNFASGDFNWGGATANVGTHTLTLSDSGLKKITDLNPNTTLALSDVTAGKVTVNPVKLTAKIGDLSKTYDAKGNTAIPSVTLSGVAGLTQPTFAWSDFELFDSSTKATEPNNSSDAGPYSIRLSAAGLAKVVTANPNATLTADKVTGGTLTIAKATITVTMDDASKNAGDPDPVFTKTFTGVPTGAPEPVFKPATVTGGGGVNTEKPGVPGVISIALDNSNPINANYDLIVITGTLTVKATSIAVVAGGKTYDNDPSTDPTVFSVTAPPAYGMTMPTWEASDFDTSGITSQDVGNYTVKLSDAGVKKLANANPDYGITADNVQSGIFNISQAKITLTIPDQQKIYKQPDPVHFIVNYVKPAMGPDVEYTDGRDGGDDVNGGKAYQIKAAGKKGANANYNVIPATGNFYILPLALSATVSDLTKDADGTTDFSTMPTVTLSAGQTTPGLVKGDFNWDQVKPAAGTYSVTLSDAGITKIKGWVREDYDLKLANVTAGKVTIKPVVAPKAQLTISIPQINKTYDGTIPTINPTITVTDVNGKTMSVPTDLAASDFDLSAVKADAGTYTISLKSSGQTKVQNANANSNIATVNTGSVVVNKANVTLTIAPNQTKTFNQTDFSLQVTDNKPANGVKVNWTATGLDQATTVNGGSPYTISVAGVANGNPNYNVTGATGSITVTPLAIKATVGSNAAKVADGNKTFTQMPTVTLSNGLTAPSTLTVSDFDWSKVQAAAGSYDVTLLQTGINKINTAVGGNYTLALANVTKGTATVTPAPEKTQLTVTIITTPKAYDGKPTITLPTVTVVDAANKAMIVPTLTMDSFDLSAVKADAGTYAVKLSLTGRQTIIAANANSVIKAAGDTTVTVTPLAIKATVGNNVTKVADGTKTFTELPAVTLSNGLTAPGLQNADFDWSGVTAATQGTYNVTLNDSGLTKINKAIGGNYHLTLTDVAAGKATISAKPIDTVKLTVTIKPVTKDYDGKTAIKTPTVTVVDANGQKMSAPLLTNDDFDLTGVGANAGTYSITLRDTGRTKILANNANSVIANTQPITGSVVVNALAIKATVGSNASKIADGTTTFTQVPTVTLSNGLIAPSTLTVDDFDWSKVQAAVGPYDVTLNQGGIDKINTAVGGNYTLILANVTKGTATITAVPVKTLQVTIQAPDKTYDGTTTIAVPTVTVSDAAKDTLIAPKLTLADFDLSNVKADAGTYSISLKTSGKDKITNANVNTKITGDVTGNIKINQATVTLKIDDQHKLFNQTDFKLVVTDDKPQAGVAVNYTTTGDDANAVNGGKAYTVTADGTTNPNYIVKSATGKLFVDPIKITATLGQVTKFADGNIDFKDVPTVTLSDGQTVGTLPKADFDWRNVKPAAGSYDVTLNGAGIAAVNTAVGDNYLLTAANVKAGKATINDEAKLAVTMTDLSKTYDGSTTFSDLPKVTVKDATGKTMVTPTLTNADFDMTAIKADAGTYTISLNGAGRAAIEVANPNTQVDAGAITSTAKISQATLKITLKTDGNKLANAADPDFTTYVSDNWNGQGNKPVYVVTRNDAANNAVGSYTITAALDAASAKNYQIDATSTTSAPFTIKAVPATPVNVTVGTTTKTYDGTTDGFTIPTVTLADGRVATGLTLTDFDWSGVKADAGSYNITLKDAGKQQIEGQFANIKVADVTTGSAVVKQATLAVSVKADSKLTNQADPDFSKDVSDNWNGKGTKPTYVVSRNDAKNNAVGSYMITATLDAASAKNYLIDPVKPATAAFIIKDVPVTDIDLTLGQISKTYDGAVQTGFTAMPVVTLADGRVATGLTAADFDWSAVKADAGTYTITLNDAGKANVEKQFANTKVAQIKAGTVGIDKAKLTATVASSQKVTNEADPDFTGAVTDNWNQKGSKPSYMITRSDASNNTVGKYTLTAVLDAASAKNYIADVTSGTFAILPQAVTASLGKVTKTYDGTQTFKNVPSVMLSNGVIVSGLPAADFDWTAVKADAGAYKVSLNDAGKQQIVKQYPNVTIASATDGIATISKANVAISLKDGSKVYGDKNVENLSQYATTDWSDKATQPTLSVTRDAGEDAGTYVMTASLSADSAKNFTAADQKAKFVISPVGVTATVGKVTKVYDGKTTGFTLPTVSLSDGTKATGLDLADFDWSKVTRADAGNYAVTLLDAGKQKLAGNHVVATVIAGLATITKAPVSIIVKGDSKLVGQSDPDLQQDIIDNSWTNTTVKPVINVTRAAGENAGSYALSAKLDADSDKNYTLTANTNATFVIKPVAVTATVEPISKDYDGTNAFTTVPTVTLATGYVVPTLSAADFDWSQVGTAAGTYQVSLNATGQNKLLEANHGNITLAKTPTTTATINQATFSITLKDDGKVAGQTDPDLNADVTKNTWNGKGDMPVITVTRVSGEDAKTYQMTAALDQKSAVNYKLTGVTTADFTISPVQLTATVKTVTKQYDGTKDFKTLPAVTLTGNAKVPTLTAADFDWSTVNTTVGSYNVTLSEAGKQAITTANKNSQLASVIGGKVTITKAPVMVTIDTPTAKYADEADPQFTAAVTGVPSGETFKPTIVRTNTSNQPGSYALQANFNAADYPNYDITVKPASLVVKALIDITATADAAKLSKTYDGTVAGFPLPTVTLSDGAVMPALSADDFDWSNVKAAAGSYTVTLNQSGLNAIAQANAHSQVALKTIGQAVINKADVNVQVASATKFADETDPDFTAKITGVPAGETFVPTITRTDSSNQPGSYALTANVDQSAYQNYNVTVEPGTLTVKALLPLTVQLGALSKTYDGTTNFADPTVTTAIDIVSAKLTHDDFDWSAVKSDAGQYVIKLNAAGKAKLAAVNPHHDVRDAAATVTIAKADVSVAAADVTKFVDDTTDPDLTWTTSGVPADGVPVKVTISRQAGETTGQYAIKVVADDNSNYNVKTTNGTFTIKPLQQLAVSMTPVDKTYDGLTTATMPVVSVDGQKVALAATDFDWSAVKSDVGQYTVSLTDAAQQTLLGKKLHTKLVGSFATTVNVTPAAVSITPQVAAKEIGTADPQFEATLVGVPQNGRQLNYQIVREPGEAVGKYTLRVKAAADQNADYVITTGTNEFTITPEPVRQITATVGDVAKNYDGLTTGFDLPSVKLSGDAVVPTLTAEDFNWSGVKADAGKYAVSLSDAGIKAITAANKNINLQVSAGTATVTPVKVSVTANDVEMTAGDAEPTLTATVLGQPDAGVAPVYTLTQSSHGQAGTYTIKVVADSAANANYLLALVDGTLTVKPAKQTTPTTPTKPTDKPTAPDNHSSKPVTQDDQEAKSSVDATGKTTSTTSHLVDQGAAAQAGQTQTTKLAASQAATTSAVAKKTTSTTANGQKQLPQTDEESGLLAAIGTGLFGLLGLAGIRKRHDDN